MGFLLFDHILAFFWGLERSFFPVFKPSSKVGCLTWAIDEKLLAIAKGCFFATVHWAEGHLAAHARATDGQGRFSFENMALEVKPQNNAL
jgi:hypothetical protein